MLSEPSWDHDDSPQDLGEDSADLEEGLELDEGFIVRGRLGTLGSSESGSGWRWRAR